MSLIRSTPVLFLAVALLAAACGADGADDGADAADARPEPPATEPVLTAGEVTEGTVEIDGVAIDYAATVPADFQTGDEAPVLLAFPPGGQDLGLTRSLVGGTYATEAQRLGWVVISPAAPDGVLFFDGSEELIPGFLDWVETWVGIEGGAPHVAGISNGGISSFRFAALNPDRVQSVVVFPGFPRSDADDAALAELTDVPIRLHVGGEDTAWVERAQEANTRLEELDADVELVVYPGEGHVMNATRDGTIIFEQLESFRG